jgi:hypothetical protein
VHLLLLASSVPVDAQSFSAGVPREYPYPSEPQYQYPVQTRQAPKASPKARCHKGQAEYQGKCRIIRPVY